MCLCDCEQLTVVRSNNLRSGGTVSCGCAQKVIASATSAITSLPHGHHRVGKRTPTYYACKICANVASNERNWI